MKKIIGAVLIAIITMSALFISLSLITYKVNTYKFTNNSKTIIFQEMVHFGEDSYFMSVNEDITNYKNKDYVYFYELINVESEEDKALMISNLGLTENVFKTIADSTKLDSQHNHMNIKNEDVNADITAKQLNDNFSKENHDNKVLVEANKIVNDVFSKFSFDSQLSTFISRNIMKLGLIINKYFSVQDPTVNKVIIEQRNDVLLSMIKESSNDKIYVQYGQLHFNDFSDKMLSAGYTFEIIDSKAVFK